MNGFAFEGTSQKADTKQLLRVSKSKVTEYNEERRPDDLPYFSSFNLNFKIVVEGERNISKGYKECKSSAFLVN